MLISADRLRRKLRRERNAIASLAGHAGLSRRLRDDAFASERESPFRRDRGQRIALALYFARLQCFRQRGLVARTAKRDTGLYLSAGTARLNRFILATLFRHSTRPA